MTRLREGAKSAVFWASVSFGVLALLPFVDLGEAHTVEVRGSVTAEVRIFPQSALNEGQHESNGAFAIEPDFYHRIGDRQSVTFIPFFRFDFQDEERTHFDIRQLYWEYAASRWELRAGINKVYWGVTESQHLVDIINQTDLVENPDTEDKLGQPMVNLTLLPDLGTFDLFVLPFFRERTFPGEDGRLRFPLVVDRDAATYESSDEENHVDFAARYSHFFGPLDVGLYHFYGTSRDPVFRLLEPPNAPALLIPHYNIINQTGLDLQLTQGGWLWKFEGIVREGQGDTFGALVAGYEYTVVGALGAADLGVISEFLYDDRGEDATTPFENDLFIGTRLALNDVQSTDVLSGVIVDVENGSSAVVVEASRRFRNDWRLSAEVRGFGSADEEDLLDAFRRDSYLQVELGRFF